jgi:hypothetical protein
MLAEGEWPYPENSVLISYMNNAYISGSFIITIFFSGNRKHVVFIGIVC